MRKRKVLLILAVILLGVWFIFNVKELHFLMKKYPTAFHQSEGFSFIRFYNTYQTLSAGQYKIDKNTPISRNCSPLNLDLPEDEHFIKLISDASYLARKKFDSNALYREETTLTYIGAKCTSKAKLVHLQYKGNEAHATFMCEQGDLVEEFTYSSTDVKCAVMQYKKDWGVKPYRTLDYTLKVQFY